MIHETFNNIDKRKRERILTAARREFSKGPLSGAKISNIVSAAGIPRGSFYQYFDTVEDVLDAVWNDMRERKRDLFQKIIVKTKGDIFSAALAIFRGEYDFFSDPENWMLAGNLPRLALFPAAAGPPAPDTERGPGPERAELHRSIDTSRLKSDDPDYVDDLLFLIAGCLKENITRGIESNIPKKDAAAAVAKQLDIIRYGAEGRR